MGVFVVRGIYLVIKLGIGRIIMIKVMDRKLVVGLEIGIVKVVVLVGEVLFDGMVNIIGVGSCLLCGMDKGGVNDFEFVVKCV